MDIPEQPVIWNVWIKNNSELSKLIKSLSKIPDASI